MNSVFWAFALVNITALIFMKPILSFLSRRMSSDDAGKFRSDPDGNMVSILEKSEQELEKEAGQLLETFAVKSGEDHSGVVSAAGYNRVKLAAFF